MPNISVVACIPRCVVQCTEMQMRLWVPACAFLWVCLTSFFIERAACLSMSDRKATAVTKAGPIPGRCFFAKNKK